MTNQGSGARTTVYLKLAFGLAEQTLVLFCLHLTTVVKLTKIALQSLDTCCAIQLHEQPDQDKSVAKSVLKFEHGPKQQVLLQKNVNFQSEKHG